MITKDLIETRFQESIDTKTKILNDGNLVSAIERLSTDIAATIKNGGKLVLCGNGGSASDALHFAGEIIGRFQKERKAWPAVVLNADVATMTAIGNDYGFDEVFARQAEAHVRPGDIFIGISTSGNSGNIIEAVLKAKELGGKTMVFSGRDGGKLKELADVSIIVPSDVTPRIQECHITIIHILCELVEELLSGE